MEEQHVFDLLPDYALDVLGEIDKHLVEAHLRECSVCRQELISFQSVVAELPAAMKMSAPSPALKTRIMSAVRSPIPAAEGGYQGTFGKWLGNLFAPRAPVWGVVSLVLVLALSISNIFLWQRVNRFSAGQEDMIAVALNHTEAAPKASGLLVMDHEGEYGVLVVDGLPVLDHSQQYQLWLIQDGERTSGGVFSVNDHGYGSLSVASPQSLLRYGSFGITIEPAGGNPGPSGPKVLGGEL